MHRVTLQSTLEDPTVSIAAGVTAGRFGNTDPLEGAKASWIAEQHVIHVT